MSRTTPFDAYQIDAVLLPCLEAQVRMIEYSSEMAKHFAKRTASIGNNTLARHLIEHVCRIRMFRPLDSQATDWISKNAPQATDKWASYARSEAVHDRYFIRDLSGIGLKRNEIDKVGPLVSTIALGKYVSSAMSRYGALPVVLYSFWTEQNSDVGSGQIIAETRKRFGPMAVQGATAHRALDEREDHAEEVSEVLRYLIKTPADLLVASKLLSGISYWVSAYFKELEVWSANHTVLQEHHLGS